MLENEFLIFEIHFLILENTSDFQIFEIHFQILENTDFCPHWLAIDT